MRHCVTASLRRCVTASLRHCVTASQDGAHFFKVVDFFDAIIVVGDAKTVVRKLWEASVAEHTAHLEKFI